MSQMPGARPAGRTVVCGDSFRELPARAPFDAIITSLPDASELGMDDMAEYDGWLRRAARLCFEAVPPQGVCVFYQTDRRADGRWYSKASTLITEGERLLWHKIVLRRDPGKRDLFRPGYSHLLAFSATGKVGAASADVLQHGGGLWANGMGFGAAKYAVDYASGFGATLCDPFCGYGTVLAFAEQRFEAVTGIDIEPAFCERARCANVRWQLDGIS